MSRYRTPDPSLPYYADDAARDFEIVLVEADPDLTNRRELLVLDDADTRGGIEQSPVFWRRDEDRFFWWKASDPFVPRLVDLSTGTTTELELPDAFEAELDDGTGAAPARLAPVPSPDGTMVGVFTLVHDDRSFTLAMSFFSAIDGSHLSSRVVPWPAVHVDPFLVTPEGWAHHFIWAGASDGVYVLDCEDAFFVPVDAEAPIAAVDTVPQLSIVTRGTEVDAAGTKLVAEVSGNEATLVVRAFGDWPIYGAEPPTAWLPYDDVPLVPLDEADYCLPR